MFFRKSHGGEKAIGAAMKQAAGDFIALAKQEVDNDRLRNEAQQREMFALALIERLESGELSESYSSKPDALAKLYKQIVHASVMSAGLRLLADYNEMSGKIYGS